VEEVVVELVKDVVDGVVVEFANMAAAPVIGINSDQIIPRERTQWTWQRKKGMMSCAHHMSKDSLAPFKDQVWCATREDQQK
jgi:hypothetical protein